MFKLNLKILRTGKSAGWAVMLVGVWNLFIGHVCMFGVLLSGFAEGIPKSGWFYKNYSYLTSFIAESVMAGPLLFLGSVLKREEGSPRPGDRAS